MPQKEFWHLWLFAKDVHDLTGIDPALVKHHLNISKGTHPVKQKKKWHFGSKKYKVIAKEVEKLVLVRHIKEVKFSK